MSTPPSDQLLRAREVIVILGCCRSTLYRLVHQGVISPPCHIGRSARWRRSEIERHVAALKGQLAKPRRPRRA